MNGRSLQHGIATITSIPTALRRLFPRVWEKLEAGLLNRASFRGEGLDYFFCQNRAVLSLEDTPPGIRV